MGFAGWLTIAVASAVGLGFAAFLYRSRETPGPGRLVLTGLRWAALLILIFLIASPEVPVPGVAAGLTRDRVLLDESLSMAVPAEPGGSETRWARAVAEARARANGRDVMLFGDAPRMVHPDSLATRSPAVPGSRLMPALRTIAEAGVRRVTVVTDGAIDDLADVARALPEIGIAIEVVTVGSRAVANRAIAEVAAPGWVASGDTIRVEVGIAALSGAGEATRIVVEHEGTPVAEAEVALPEPGRVGRTELAFVPDAPEEGALLRYDIRIVGEDDVPDDDARSVYVHVSADPPGVVVLSLRPDWEPRFLLPVLEDALGLPASGFLRGGDGRYVRVGTGADAGRQYTEAQVRRIVEAADLVVLHGLDPAAPEWALGAARTARRLIVFPAEGVDLEAVGLPVVPSTPSAGDWYVHGEIPPSPVAPLLSSFGIESLPPLAGVRATEPVSGAWAPLVGSRDRRGLAAPLVLAGERDGRRWVVALADGYWRWAFRGGDSRQLYRHLWGSLAGWLVRDERAVAVAPVRPADRTVARGEPVAWVAPGLAPDSIAVRLYAEDGTVALDTVVPALRPDTAFIAALEPGHYRFEATAFARGQTVAQAEGPFTAERYAAEFMSIAGDVPARPDAAGGTETRAARATVPLHTLPWVYVLLVAILSAEWILRRRWGLR